ncbi:hypothetical protein [Neobacillus sp. D3-1R]|uniref:hypothetical protein n=1 Tax=Neobacillus sp. D3-1R TaxID=3445778 RepID=UPI003FA0085E
MKEKIESIVRRMVMDYLNKEKKSPKNKRLLIILDEQRTLDKGDVWIKLKAIADTYQVTLLVTNSWTSIPEEIGNVKTVPLHEDHLEEIMNEMQKSDILLYATASYSTLAKLSLTMDEGFPLWITIQMQMDGKQIILASDYLTPKGTQNITAPFTVTRRIQTYIRQVREDKVQVLALSSIRKWLESYFNSVTESRHVVLAKHIEEAAKMGESQLVVPKNSLITPMCKDYARELGVLIKQKE